MLTKLKCQLYFKSGSKTRAEYVEVKKAVDALGPEKCASLLGLHSFTGCDTVSSLAGRGKVAAMRVLSHQVHMNTLQSLGESWVLPDEAMKKLEALTCAIYSTRTTINSVNEMRFELFVQERARPNHGKSHHVSLH